MERLTEEDLHEMQLSGLVSIQPHTVTHPRLTLVDSKQLQIEVRESKRYIEVLLGNVCRAFAYPYGKSNVEIIRALMDGGYEYALTTQSGVVSPAHLFKENGMYLLPRNDINQSISLDEFIRLVAPGKSWIRRYVDRIQLYF